MIDHWIHPRNWGRLSDGNGYARIKGPCGDAMEISFKVRDGKIVRCGFATDGCGVAIACGSVMTELILGKSVSEADTVTKEAILQALGGLPEREHHCAILSADTLHQAIKKYERRQM